MKVDGYKKVNKLCTHLLEYGGKICDYCKIIFVYNDKNTFSDGSPVSIYEDLPPNNPQFLGDYE